MKKILILFTVLMTCLNTYSEEYKNTSIRVEDFIKIIDKVEGYVFLSEGERRDLSLPFARTDAVFSEIESAEDLRALNWSSMNNDIVFVDKDGMAKGQSFGETIITVKDDNNELHNFIVFVCPTVTVKSPEGAIYTHHKVYNQKAKIYFTQSKDYLINCVMLNGEDITDKVKIDENEDGDGYYESEEPIISNMTFVISMESREENEIGQVVGGSDINLQVQGKNITFVNTDETKQSIVGKNVKIKDVKRDKTVYNNPLPPNNTISIETKGIYYVEIEGINGDFKVIID